MLKWFFGLTVLLKVAAAAAVAQTESKFLWGSATASYQVEGAVNEDGRGPSVWDEFSHLPGKTANGDTGDVADDNYHRFKEDIDLIRQLGLNSYRMSLSWTRLFPNGDDAQINHAGVTHYNQVIDKLVEAGITPFVTLFHWDTPLSLEKRFGGWLSSDMEKYFARYADSVFAAFGDRVKHWITLNEPLTVALCGYNSGVHAPGRCSDRSRCAEGNSSTEPYIAAHNMLNAHAAAVEVYRQKYQAQQGGVIGITLNTDFGYPLTDSQEDKDAAVR